MKMSISINEDRFICKVHKVEIVNCYKRNNRVITARLYVGNGYDESLSTKSEVFKIKGKKEINVVCKLRNISNIRKLKGRLIMLANFIDTFRTTRKIYFLSGMEVLQFRRLNEIAPAFQKTKS